MSLSIVILAAGLGKRMKSRVSKPLQLLAGRPMITHLYQTAKKISDSIFVVYGKQQSEVLKNSLPDSTCRWVCQEQPLGTGHALLQILPYLTNQKKILVLYVDTPLVSEVVLNELIGTTREDALGLITTIVEDPVGLGRVLRDKSEQFLSIIEEHEATNEQQLLKEINTGIGLFPSAFLKEVLPTLSNQNKKQEYYLTDVFALAKQRMNSINLVKAPYCPSLLGVNNKMELGVLERHYQIQQAQWLQRQGVSILDASRFDCRGNVKIGKDCVIDVGVIFEGEVVLGDRCRIGPYCYVKDCELSNDIQIDAHCVLEGAIIKKQAKIGPFARVRADTIIGEQAKVGNFVEIKKTTLGTGTKANHLAYLGNAKIGEQVNIGAGAITCNYNGISKENTIIKDNAFIGSNTSLVAPIEIGQRVVVGAGSVLTQSVPDDHLALSRSKQKLCNRLLKKDDK